MGLLTSDSSGKPTLLIELVTKHDNKLFFLTFLSGFVVAGFLLWEPNTSRTYFSDNALLPGLVQREFTLGNFAQQTLDSLKTEAKVYVGKIPYPWIKSQFQQLGLEVYTHNYTFNYPFGLKPVYRGKNIYAILRTPRAASTEALVLSSPYRDESSIHGSTLPSIALMIALAKYFVGRTYWAKDIIFLVNEHELVGIQAWLNAYHEERTNAVLDHGILEARSGAIQAAVNLEIHGDKLSQIEIKIEGLNGQLPNLDLFNVAVELCTRESITPTFHGYTHPVGMTNYEIWKQYALTTGAMMISQGITLPTGAHGIFQRFSIQAITLEGIEAVPHVAKRRSHLLVTLLHVGRVVEGIFRSLNNLLEKFNRSYYFYLLPSTRRYVSIGFYMIPFALLVVPLLVKALHIYLSVGTLASNNAIVNLWQAIPNCCLSHVCGIALLLFPLIIERFNLFLQNYPTEDVIYFTLISLSVAYMISPLQKFVLVANFNTFRCIALLNLALVLNCLALVNISLALGLSVVLVPIFYITQRWNFTFSRIANGFLVLLVHPLVLHYICLFILSLWTDTKFPVSTHFSRTYDAQKKVILFYIEDWYIYGNWTYFFTTAFLFPVWLQFWSFV